MGAGELTYNDFLSRLSIQDVLIDAGYRLNKRDGLRYPSYVRLDSDGRRIRGDKFIVTQNGQCCFQPPHQKLYNVISFIKAHPQMFAEYRAGMQPDRLVNLVCNRLLHHPIEQRETKIVQPWQEAKPFDIENYVVEELTDGSIILVDFNLGYYLVKPNLTHKYLFTATSYASSKNKLAEWMSRLRKQP